MNLDFSVIDLAGLSQREFADLSGVSRVIVNRYINRRTAVGSRSYDKVKRTLGLLNICVKLKLLPQTLPGTNNRHTTEERKHAIDTAMARAVDAVKAHKARQASD
jgi:transcriptional regulator with XRE-family HTH domain